MVDLRASNCIHMALRNIYCKDDSSFFLLSGYVLPVCVTMRYFSHRMASLRTAILIRKYFLPPLQHLFPVTGYPAELGHSTISRVLILPQRVQRSVVIRVL